MKVTVRLFAAIRQQAGWARKEIELAEHASIAALLAALAAEQPALDLFHRPLYAAVNQQYVQQDAQLCEGDEVALFPPVSGGQPLLLHACAATMKAMGGLDADDPCDGIWRVSLAQ